MPMGVIVVVGMPTLLAGSNPLHPVVVNVLTLEHSPHRQVILHQDTGR